LWEPALPAGNGLPTPGVYVRQEEVESEVIKGLETIFALCTDKKGFTERVNEELKKIWEASTGCDANAERMIQALDAKIKKRAHRDRTGTCRYWLG
jgi:hypothetical protein